jgi:hypothetical protein
MSDYMTVDEFCAERGLDLTAEQRAELDAHCEALCREKGHPWKKRLLAPDGTVVSERWTERAARWAPTCQAERGCEMNHQDNTEDPGEAGAP